MLSLSLPLTVIPIPPPLRSRKKSAVCWVLPDGMEVLLGNGSDELIQLLALALNKPRCDIAGRGAIVRDVPDDRNFYPECRLWVCR